jgi:hypothetical protein
VLLNRASWLGAVALLCFLLAVLVGGLSMAYPPVRALKTLGTVSLFAGLFLVGAAVSLELRETVLTRREIEEEIADLDDEAKQWLS